MLSKLKAWRVKAKPYLKFLWTLFIMWLWILFLLAIFQDKYTDAAMILGLLIFDRVDEAIDEIKDLKATITKQAAENPTQPCFIKSTVQSETLQ
jgi:hypothetical protein